MKLWPAYLVLLALAFLGGRLSRKPEVRVETKTEVKWQERVVTVAATNASAERKQSVRVVTRWLRPDGTAAREQTRDVGSSVSTNSHTTGESHQETRLDSARVSESPIANPRWHVGAMLGLDLRAGLERRWGGYASYRIVGPIHLGAFYLPGLAGGSIGVTF